MRELVNFEDGIAFSGNTERIERVMRKAEEGKPITVGFLGGSITQGSLSSTPDTCYAALVYQWWKEQFPQSEVTYRNAGIGGTTSQFGAARVEEDLLACQPDFVVIEFSVNDDNTVFFRETYEGLVRRVYGSDGAPAVLLVHNVLYQTGTNAQDQHETIGRYYGIPCVSMKTSVYQSVAQGKIPVRSITPDDLHPNDAGHRLLADLIIYFLTKVQNRYCRNLDCENPDCNYRGTPEALPAPITANAYEHSVRYQKSNAAPKLDGFTVDTEEQKGLTDIFKNGFLGDRLGASIHFEIKGTGLAAQYRRSVKQPACVAQAVVDGDTAHPIVLDGNFDETWGDSLTITTLLYHGEDKVHTVDITITEGNEAMVPFYLVSVIGSR